MSDFLKSKHKNPAILDCDGKIERKMTQGTPLFLAISNFVHDWSNSHAALSACSQLDILTAGFSGIHKSDYKHCQI
jgi:hypothetical protein